MHQRTLTASVFIVIFAVSASAQYAIPESPIETRVPVPKEKRKNCGNNKVETYAISCSKLCFQGDQNCTESCEERSETCDGRDLGTGPYGNVAVCTDSGYRGGTLRCNKTCDGYDFTRCDICAEGATCKQLSIPARLQKATASMAVSSDGSFAILFTTYNGPEVVYLFDKELRLKHKVRLHFDTYLINAVPGGYVVFHNEGRLPGEKRVTFISKRGRTKIVRKSAQILSLYQTANGPIYWLGEGLTTVGAEGSIGKEVPLPLIVDGRHALLLYKLTKGEMQLFTPRYDGVPNLTSTENGDLLLVKAIPSANIWVYRDGNVLAKVDLSLKPFETKLPNGTTLKISDFGRSRTRTIEVIGGKRRIFLQTKDIKDRVFSEGFFEWRIARPVTFAGTRQVSALLRTNLPGDIPRALYLVVGHTNEALPHSK